MVINRTSSCCGVGEIEGLYGITTKNVKDTLLEIGENHFPLDEKYPLYFWADIVRNGKGNGKTLCDYIRSQNIGFVYRSKTKKNPNSGNYINSYLWNVNHIEFRKWWNKNKS